MGGSLAQRFSVLLRYQCAYLNFLIEQSFKITRFISQKASSSHDRTEQFRFKLLMEKVAIIVK